MNYRKIGLRLFWLSAILLPSLTVLLVIGFHSKNLIIPSLHYLVFLLFFIMIILFVASFFFLWKSRKEKLIQNKLKTIALIMFMILYLSGTSVFLFLLYGPSPRFRSWLIPTAMTTMNHQYLATWFYNSREIQNVLDENQIIERDEDTDLNLIEIGNIDFNNTIYKDEYEKELLTKDPNNDNYKIIKIKGEGYEGYLAAIYDPTKVKVATTKYLHDRGEYVTDMASHRNALLAINGGGFIDPNYSSNGGTPHGIVIQNGQIINNQAYNSAGGLIGFTNENKMILGKMNANEALAKGVRDAVTFGPFLIVNGKRSFIKGNGGWGSAPRTAIGQRKDGIVLFLVIDGRKWKMPGADMVDLTDIMEQYGAYNAANLDGGTSSVLVMPKQGAQNYLSNEEQQSHCRNEYCYINDPIDGGGSHATRWVASAFIVE